jgi:hypothetical protein
MPRGQIEISEQQLINYVKELNYWLNLLKHHYHLSAQEATREALERVTYLSDAIKILIEEYPEPQ